MNALRAIPAGMLAAAAAVLGGASKLAELGARRLAPRSDAPEPRHPSFLDTAPDTAPEQAPPTLRDVVPQERVDVEDVVTEDLVTAADFAAELDPSDPLLRADDAVALDDELDAVAGDDVVADDALDAMVADALDADTSNTAASNTAASDTAASDTAADEMDAAVLGDDGAARTYESHIAELADRNVASVVREIQDLSTEELGQLFEYESAHRKRKTVLQAIERAAAPDGATT